MNMACLWIPGYVAVAQPYLCKLCESHVVADANSNACAYRGNVNAVVCRALFFKVEITDLVAGSKRIALLKHNFPWNVDVEEVHLAVANQD